MTENQAANNQVEEDMTRLDSSGYEPGNNTNVDQIAQNKETTSEYEESAKFNEMASGRSNALKQCAGLRLNATNFIFFPETALPRTPLHPPAAQSGQGLL